MEWILSASNEITVDVNELKARTNFIRQVTGAEVTDWKSFKVNGLQSSRQFLRCSSNDVIKGVFITAHNDDVFLLSTLQYVYANNIIIANTCIWEKLADKRLLFMIRKNNMNAELYFSKQDMTLEHMNIFRQTTTLHKVGNFGFQTSLSERELFINRQKGFEEALKLSFERVSPILMTGD